MRRVSLRPIVCLGIHVEAAHTRCLLGRWNVSVASKTERTTETIRERHDRLRRQGLRPVRIWVPDPRAAAFEAEAHRQAAAVASRAEAADDQDFIDSVSRWDDA